MRTGYTGRIGLRSGDLYESKLYAIESDIGWLAFWGDHRVLLGAAIGHSDQLQAIRALTEKGAPLSSLAQLPDLPNRSWLAKLVRKMTDYTAGTQVCFDDVPIELSQLSNFRQRVIIACRQIPYGETVTYSQLAARAGSPKAARAVGTTMAQNLYPIIVPCHRVVGADGSLRGFSAPRGVSLKQRLLEMERQRAGKCFA